MRLTPVYLLVFLALDAQAQNPESPSTQQVVVNGSKTDVEAGRDFVAGKIVIGKERIAESGVQNTGELLRREPAISVGKNGSLGLLGMNGYTQILVDGLPHSGDPLALDLVHVERIEIIKTSTAATGPFGIAGTINIIRKGVQRQALTTLRTGASVSRGRVGADLAWSSNQLASNSPFAYNLSVSARRIPARSDSRSAETLEGPQGKQPVYESRRDSSRAFQTFNAAAELSWQPAPGHKLSLSPDAGRFVETSDSMERRNWLDGRSLGVNQRARTPLSSAALPLRWDWEIDADSRLSVNARLLQMRVDTDAEGSEQWRDAPPRARMSTMRSDSIGRFLNLDYNTVLGGKHEIAAGAKLMRNERDLHYLDLVDGRPDPSLALLGPASNTWSLRKQLFIQDDWRIDRTLAVNFGVAAERQDLRLTESPFQARRRFTLWSPSGHVARKIGGDSKRQLRFSLARSFQPPEIDRMLLRPRINAFAPCPSTALCGANGIGTADSSGNPALEPERARSMNLSYTHGLGKGSEVRIEGYARDIRNKIGSELALEEVPWADAPRWVYRPANLGRAEVRGIELEGRLSGKDVAPRWSTLELRGSVGWADSILRDLPGPDNRLAGQTPWRAKLGGSYTLKDLPLKLGVESNYLPSDWTRSSLNERVYASHRFTLGANAAWQLNAKSKITLNLDNLLHRTGTRIDEYRDAAILLRTVTGSSDDARLSLRFDTRL